MKETSCSTARVAVKLVVSPAPCPPSNFLVHLNFHHLHVLNFRPVLNYNSNNNCFHDKYHGFEFSADELQSFDTIVQAVDDIMSLNLGLVNKLKKNQIAYIARCIEMWKDFLLVVRTVSYYIEARIDIKSIYLVENLLPLDALVKVRMKDDDEDDDDDDDDERCVVCLEGFDEDDRDVYKTCCCHVFHCKCIGEWLAKKGDCPLCRFRLVRDDCDL